MRSRIAGLFSTAWDCCPPSARKPGAEHGTWCDGGRAKGEDGHHDGDEHDDDQEQRHNGFPEYPLNLNPDDLTDHEISNRLQSDSRHQQRVADGILE